MGHVAVNAVQCPHNARSPQVSLHSLLQVGFPLLAPLREEMPCHEGEVQALYMQSRCFCWWMVVYQYPWQFHGVPFEWIET